MMKGDVCWRRRSGEMDQAIEAERRKLMILVMKGGDAVTPNEGK